MDVPYAGSAPPWRSRTGVSALCWPVMPRASKAATSALRATLFEIIGEECEWPGCGEPASEMAHRIGKGMGGRSSVYTLAEVFGLCRFHHRCQDGEGGETIDGRSRRDEVYVLYAEMNPDTFPGLLFLTIDNYLHETDGIRQSYVVKLKYAISEALWRYARAGRVGVMDDTA